MAEQKYMPQNDQDSALHPAEGREDVASDVEEEQRAAYSAHQRRGTSAQPRSSGTSTTMPRSADVPPVEGREDVASDVEEQQRNSYTAHHS